MKQTVSVKELKSGGYTRFPRLFIDLLLQDYYPKNFIKEEKIQKDNDKQEQE